MPVLPTGATAADRARAADEQDRRAVALERVLSVLSIRLFDAERAAILDALSRAESDDAVRRVLAAIIDAYRAPAGLFRRAWTEALSALGRETAVTEAARVAQATARVTGQPVPPLTAPQRVALTDAADARAAQAAAEITATTADRIAAVADAVAPIPPAVLRAIEAARAAVVPPATTATTTSASAGTVRTTPTTPRTPGGSPPTTPGSTPRTPAGSTTVTAEVTAGPGGPDGGRPAPGPVPGHAPPRPAVIQQRIDSLAPLIGREAAEQVVDRVAATLAAGQPTRAVVKELVQTVTATPINRVRATRIGRTESIGLLNAAAYDAVTAQGILTRKRWITQLRNVRDSHQRCGAQGIIPIGDRFVNGLLYPGERPAPAKELINCRCSLSALP